MARSIPANERRERVVFEHDSDGTWVARTASRPGTIARGGSIAQARKRIREALTTNGRARRAAPAPAVEEILLPPAARTAIEALDRARAGIETAERNAVTVLVRRLGLGVRDAAQVLGITMRRVVHLAGEVADLEAAQKASRRRAAPR